MLGGHGYIAEWGMEQFVRDARIAMIYEGANGMQALDLVGRKLPKDGGRAIMAFFGEISGFLAANKDDAALAPYLAPLKAALGHLQQATMWLQANGLKNPDNAGAASNDYMHLFGLTALGYHVGADRQGGAWRDRREGTSTPGARRQIDRSPSSSTSVCCRKRRRIWRGISAGAETLMALSGGGVLKPVRGRLGRWRSMRRLASPAAASAARCAIGSSADADRRQHLPLPHVPEGERRAVHGLRGGAAFASSSSRSGALAIFSSSDIAERGFCADAARR